MQNLPPTLVKERLDTQEKDFIVLDVRENSEFVSGHIAGAKHIPLGQLTSKMDRLPKDKEVICVCRSGARSGRAARQLSRAGYKVSNIKGGMMAWSAAKLPVQKGGGGGKKKKLKKR